MSEVINLSLSVDEANVIIAALAELPYKNVYELIPKIQTQAKSQLAGSAAALDPADM